LEDYHATGGRRKKDAVYLALTQKATKIQPVYASPAANSDSTVHTLLDASGLPGLVSGARTILIKPNLVNCQGPPVTTPVSLVASVVRYLQNRCTAEIVIAEGTASAEHDTWHVFRELGYLDLAAAAGVRLLDLNQEETICRSLEHCRRWPRMHLPEIVYESFLLSMPVLKAHTLAGVTLTLKNMMGLAPPTHYRISEQGWKKAAFHHRIHEAIADLNRYRHPDFTLLDASVGMAESHLWGATCQPPVGLLAAGTDPVAIDAWGCGVLGKKWQDIDHIRVLHGELGQAAPLCISALEMKGTNNAR